MSDWWRTAVFYELYVRSFADGNGDGVGDFIGITGRLDYLKDLGIDCIWLTPFYASPNIDYGYDIADYYSIDPAYGTMDDFETFVSEAHSRGIRVIADLVPNHTSDQHSWFLESRLNRTNPKRNWYVWKDPVNGGVPNNWESGFGQPSWTYDPTTQQYFYHAFSKHQVDLNWANPEVEQEMFRVMRYWLDKGLDGFRIDVINHLCIDREFRDNPVQDEEQLHLYDKDRPETMDIIRRMRKLVDSYPDKVLVGEIATEDVEVAKRYIDASNKLHLGFNFNLGSIPKLDVERICTEMLKIEQELPQNCLPTLFFSSHDMSRHVSRMGQDLDEISKERLASVFATLILTGRGVPFLYYGEEIGMRDIYVQHPSALRDVAGIIAYEEKIDTGVIGEEALKVANSKGRDKGRSPMQWNDGPFAGFSYVEPWLPVHPDYRTRNVKVQQAEPTSLLELYQELLSLRKRHAMLSNGNYGILGCRDNVIYYTKQLDGEQVLVLLNFNPTSVHLSTLPLSDFQLSQCNRLFSSRKDVVDKHRDMSQLHAYEAVILNYNATGVFK